MKVKTSDFFHSAEQALLANDLSEKKRLVTALTLPDAGFITLSEPQVMQGNLQPGRPDKPELVHPGRVKKRRLHSERGRIALVHAVAHIEFNAINLALDALWRFRGMPATFYEDWLQVAKDELRHFGWLSCRLQSMGSDYGDLPAHDGLWEAAVKTAGDPLHRMALVPRVLEARGLDVTPGMIERLSQVGDSETVAILVKILDEEVAHVEAGSRWFRYLCRQRGVVAEEVFPQLLQEYLQSLPRGPFNLPARIAAGFSSEEIRWLTSLDAA